MALDSGYFEVSKPAMTNADRIRSMSDEELKDFLLDEEWNCDAYHCCSVCPRYREGKCVPLLEWLKQPAEE